jgi:spoIIIJ-associated protein
LRSIETSGKTVEDAVKAGLAELKCDSSDVSIDVLEMGSPGLFGMFGKLARVRLTVKEVVDDFAFDLPAMTLDTPKLRQEAKPSEKKPQQEPKAEAKPEPKPVRVEAEKPEKKQPAENPAPVIKSVAEFKASRRDPKEPREAKEPREPREPREVKEPREPREPREVKEPREPREPREVKEPREQRAPKEPRPQREPRRRPESAPQEAEPSVIAEELPPLDLATLGESGKRAYEFLSNVTNLMGVQVEIRIKEAEGHLFAQMSGDALGVLIGRRGETLDALQYLTSLQVNKGQEEYTRVSLDSEHYRAKREDALRKLAARMASRARKTGHRVALEPMNPYERRVLHSALQDNPYVTTHSEGEEPYRRVIITLK